MENYLVSTRKSYGLTTQYIQNTLYKSVFDNYQQIDY